MVELSEESHDHLMQLYEYVRSEESLQTYDHELYRRVLGEAWRSNLCVDPSEAGLLAVLRHELHLTPTDHFLTLHHGDLRDLASAIGELGRELTALAELGVLYIREEVALIPGEIEEPLRTAMGLPLQRQAMVRLLEWFSSKELSDTLGMSGLRLSGDKAQKIQRLVARLISPTVVLQGLGISRLQEIASGVGCSRAGSKDELIDRLVRHFLHGLDVPAPEEPAEELPAEPKLLTERAFLELFSSLSNRDLAGLMEALGDVPISGNKTVRIGNLWISRHSESTLLALLSSRQLQDVLSTLDLKLGGSKSDRIQRLIEHFSHLGLPEDRSTQEPNGHHGEANDH